MGKRKGTNRAYKRRVSRRATRPARRRKPAGVRELVHLLDHVPQALAARTLGVSTRTLRDAVDAPRLTDGRYDLRVLFAWWVEREKRKLPAGPSPAKERIAQAHAEKLERENAIQRGKLLDIDIAAHTVRWIHGVCNERLMALARASTPEQASAIEAAVEQMREQIEAAFPAIQREERAAIEPAAGGSVASAL